MDLIKEIEALEEFLAEDESFCGKEVLKKIINDKWKQYFKKEKLSLKNRMQVELMKKSGLKKVVWIKKYAVKFSKIYEKETSFEEIEKNLYGRRNERQIHKSKP